MSRIDRIKKRHLLEYYYRDKEVINEILKRVKDGDKKEVTEYVENYVPEEIQLPDGHMFVFSFENRGDGSGNFADYFYPEIRTFDNVRDLKRHMYTYLKKDYGVTKKDIKLFIQAGGVAMDENACIRVFTVDKNNPKYPEYFGNPEDYPSVSG